MPATMEQQQQQQQQMQRSGKRPPRSFSLSNLLSDIFQGGSSTPSTAASSPQQQQQQQQQQQGSAMKRFSSAGDVEGLGRCPYSAVLKNPGVPYEFQMPVHYPRFSRAQYDEMPEWQLDQLLEEYGMPASDMGTLDDKRDYAKGAFVWN